MARAMNDYINDAKKIYDGQYATKLADLERVKGERLSDYDNSSKSINTQYDQSIDQNRKDGIGRVNSYNNNTLARGIGRSTIATTGIAGIENTTARLDNDLRREKAAKIAELLTQRNNYLSDYERQVRALNDEKQSVINKYAMDLYNRDVDYDRQQALAAASRSYSSGGGSSSASYSNNEVSNAMSSLMSDFNKYIKNGDSKNARELLYLGLDSVAQGYLSHQDYIKMQDSLKVLEDKKQAKKDKYNPNKKYGYRNGVAGYY